MAEQVRITSMDALESLRAGSIVFMTRARQALDQAGDEVRRTRQWLEDQQRPYWEGEIRKRRRALEQAESELMSARLSEFIENPTVQQAAVRKARAAVEQAEEKLRAVKRHLQNYDGMVGGHIKKLEAMRHFLDQDMPKAVIYLSQVQRTLDSYTRVQPPDSSAPTGSPDAGTPTANS